MTVTPARRLPNGLWRPWAADFLAGLKEQARLRELGLTLDLGHGEVAAMGQALANGGEGQAVGQYWTREPVLSEELTRALDALDWTRQLALDQHELDHRRHQLHDHARLLEEGVALGLDHARLQAMGLDLDGARAHPVKTPELDESSDLTDQDSARGGTVARQQQRNRGQNGKKDPIKEMVDFEPPDEEWRPA